MLHIEVLKNRRTNP